MFISCLNITLDKKNVMYIYKCKAKYLRIKAI